MNPSRSSRANEMSWVLPDPEALCAVSMDDFDGEAVTLCEEMDPIVNVSCKDTIPWSSGRGENVQTFGDIMFVFGEYDD